MGQFKRASLGDFVFRDHFGESGSQCRTRRFGTQPVALFRAQNFIVRESICTESELLAGCRIGAYGLGCRSRRNDLGK